MARAKKDTKAETQTEQELLTQTATEAGLPPSGLTPESEPGAQTLADLELGAAASLDPDAPQTEGELDPGSGQLPQTELEPIENDGTHDAEPTNHPDLPQTGLESAGDEAPSAAEFADISQTGSEIAEGVEDRPDPEGKIDALHTDPETPPDESVTESEPEEGSENPHTDPEQPKNRLRMPGRRGQRVVSIDAERTVETDTDKLRSDLLDLVESLKGRKILTGTIQGVERLADNPEMSYAVTYHGDYKVIIPVLEAVEEPEDYRDQPRGDVLHYLLNKRLGAEVDYIVKGIDQESGIVAASRLEAMALKRREYYFRTDRDGNYQIYAGIRAEARVVSVIRAGIFVDLFGAECYIPLRELSYQRWVDATAHYQPGQRVLVKVLEVDRGNRDKLQVSASVKQAGKNPYEAALKKYAVGNRYVGTVSMVDTTGVFVSLDGGIDCLCTYPKRGRPPRGCRVTVRILGINHESNRIWGVITHMSTVR